MPDPDLIAEGREKLAAATPGPWETYEPDPGWWWVWQASRLPNYGGVMEVARNTEAVTGDDGGIGDAQISDQRSPERDRADAELIVHMRNTYEQLLDIVDEARKRLASHEKSVHWMRQQRDDARARIAELEPQLDRVTDLFEAWAAEENEHRLAGELGIAEGLHVAIEALRESVHGAAFAQSTRQRHTWECANRTRIGVPELDACDCPEVDRG